MNQENKRKSWFNLKIKMYLFTLIPILAVLIISSLTIYNKIEYERNLIRNSIESYAHLLESEDLSFESIGQKERLKSILNEEVIISEIIEKDLSVEYTTGSQKTASDFTENEQELINRAFDGYVIMQNTENEDSKILISLYPIIINNKIVGVLHLQLSYKESNKRISQYVLFIAILNVIVIIISYLIVNILSKRIILDKIYELKKGYSEISKNNFNYKIKFKSNDELSELGNEFNKMSQELRKYKSEVGKYSKELERKVEKRTKELDQKVSELTETKTAMLNMMEDIDKTNRELVEAQKKLKKSFGELKKLDKEKDKFISIAAHELKTPMTAIHGFSQLLKNEKIIKIADTRNKYLNIIENETNRLSRLVTDILELSRADLGTLKFSIERVDVPKLIDEVKESLTFKAKEKGLKLTTEIKEKLPVISTDREKLKQIMINLVGNSIKYSEKGTIKVSVSKKDKFIKFSVADTGIGIPKKAQKKIFTRFYQVESHLTRKVGGTGLGLSICKEFVDAMGGEIWFESKPEKGSTFFFTLPMK